MELTSPCPICHTLSACNCSRDLVRYCQILEAVSSRRVLNEKAASKAVGHPKVMGAGVDKLIINILGAYSKLSLVKTAKSDGYHIAETSMKESGRFLKVTKGNYFVHFRYLPTAKVVTQMICNPNRFGSWGAFVKFINSIVPLEIIQNMEIMRLDLNLDFNCSFKNLISSIDVKSKSMSVQFSDKSGTRTGITIGTGNEFVVIYDKSRESETEEPWSRMELRLKGKKLPTKSIFDIPIAVSEMEAFDFLTGHNLSFTELPSKDEKFGKQREFKTILDRDGYYSARKVFNINRNFARDFASLIKVAPWQSQPADLFKAHIGAFTGADCANSTVIRLH